MTENEKSKPDTAQPTGQTEGGKNNKLQAFASRIKIFVSRKQQQHATTQKPENATEQLTRRIAWAGLFVSIISATASISQCSAAKGQISEMQNEQRAWLNIEAKPVGDFQYVDAINKDTGLHVFSHVLRLETKVVNVGHNPAFKIFTDVRGFVDGGNNSVVESMRNLCKQMKNFGTISYWTNFVLFPGDFIDGLKVDFGTSYSAGFNESDFINFRQADNEGRVSMSFFGCVRYSSSDNFIHTTSFAYSVMEDVSEKGDGTRINLVSPNRTIPGNRLVIFKERYGEAD